MCILMTFLYGFTINIETSVWQMAELVQTRARFIKICSTSYSFITINACKNTQHATNNIQHTYITCNRRI